MSNYTFAVSMSVSDLEEETGLSTPELKEKIPSPTWERSYWLDRIDVHISSAMVRGLLEVWNFHAWSKNDSNGNGSESTLTFKASKTTRSALEKRCFLVRLTGRENGPALVKHYKLTQAGEQALIQVARRWQINYIGALMHPFNAEKWGPRYIPHGHMGKYKVSIRKYELKRGHFFDAARGAWELEYGIEPYQNCYAQGSYGQPWNPMPSPHPIFGGVDDALDAWDKKHHIHAFNARKQKREREEMKVRHEREGEEIIAWYMAN